jgi:hypothetical protein
VASQNGDSLCGKVFLRWVSPFWHQTPVRPDEKEGKPVNSDSEQTLDQQADLIDFMQLARSPESHFETAHHRTFRSPLQPRIVQRHEEWESPITLSLDRV